MTIRTPSLAVAESLYSRYLHYRVISREAVTPAQARCWQLPDLAGTPALLMAPEAPANDQPDFTLRFIELPLEAGFRAFTRHGWQAVELIVRHVDTLYAELRDSPFEIVAPPMDLSFCTDIRAMQIRGPGGEIVYLTEVKRPVPGLDTPPVRCAVDRSFIVIVGGPSMSAIQGFFKTHFGMPEAPVVESRVQTMALEFGLSREHRFPIAALPLLGRCYIEADEMPAEAQPLPAVLEELPSGVAMVSFLEAPAAGILPGTVRCERGAAGELVELIAS